MEYILQCDGLQKSYGPKAALCGVNLAVEPGHIVGLLGPNGSGKTTLIKLISGILTPTAGSVRICGRAPGVESRALTAYLPERSYLPDWMRVEEAAAFFGDFYKDFAPDTAAAMLRRLGIDPKAKLKALSKGTREKLQLILVMSRKARLYLLDEPIGGVDPATRDYILHTIISNYNPEASVLLSTHLIADVEPVLDQIVFLKDGQVALFDSADNVREAQGKSIDDVFREVFRC